MESQLTRQFFDLTDLPSKVKFDHSCRQSTDIQCTRYRALRVHRQQAKYIGSVIRLIRTVAVYENFHLHELAIQSSSA